MKKTLKLIILLTLVLNFTSCKKEETQTDAEYLQLKINNVMYKVTPGAGITPGLNGNDLLTISGIENNDLNKSISLSISNYTGPGTYQIGVDVTSNIAVNYPDNNYSVWPNTVATVNITEENGYLKGSFSGNIENPDTEEIFPINEGKFYVKINSN